MNLLAEEIGTFSINYLKFFIHDILFVARCDGALAIMTCVAEVCAKLGIDPSKDLH